MVFQVYWAENGERLAIATEDSYFLLKYDPKAVTAFLQKGEAVSDDGIEEAFDVSSHEFYVSRS